MWQWSECKCICFTACSLRTKSFTLICICGDCNAILLFTSRKKISTSVLLSGSVCSYINTNDLFQYQTRNRLVWFFFSRMLFVRALCKEYHVIADELNRMCWLVDSLDHIYDKILSYLNSNSDIANKKISNFSSYNNVQYYRFQSAEIKESGAALVITIASGYIKSITRHSVELLR